LVNEPEIIASVAAKAERFKKNLVHERITLIRNCGLLMAVELESQKMAWDFIYKGAEMGIITDPFLFCESCIRIAPPLTITNQEIDEVCTIILKVLDAI
jgi:acetylornithine/succinyldiaminopimelate/putrescine aminotransferase